MTSKDVPSHAPPDSSPAQPLLQIRDLHMEYGRNKVLKGINLEFHAGSFCALLGRNGAGKSTLMKILMRAELHTRGTIDLKGLHWDEDSREWPQLIAMVSEGWDVPLPLSIRAFYQRARQFYANWNEARFQALLQEFRFDDSKTFGSLSRGQKVQVTLAAAIAAQPKLILLDEVTAVLDSHARAVTLRALRNFADQGGTVILATNIATEVHQCADQVAVIENGTIAVHEEVSRLSTHFCKLRQIPGKTTLPEALLHHPKSVFLARNSDQSESFLIRWEDLRAALPTGVSEELRDRRSITIEDIFLYFTSQAIANSSSAVNQGTAAPPSRSTHERQQGVA